MKEIYLKSNIHKILNNDLTANMLNHSYLLISNDKFKINEFCKYIACTILAGEYFDGIVATKIFHGNHADVKEYPTGSKGIVTEDISRIVNDSYVLPMEGDKKVYILKNFEQATVQAQNKLLKTLEEPSKSVVFIITTSNESGVLPTIRSRCKKVAEGKLNQEDVLGYITSHSKLTAEDAQKLAQLSEGNLTLVDSYINDKKYLEMVSLSEEIFNNLSSSAGVLNYSSKMLKYKANLEDFLNIMMLTLRNVFVNKVTKQTPTNIVYSNKALANIVWVINEGIEKVKSNCNPNSVCDGVLMGILEVRYKCQK